jgi:hypothetical protein
MLKFHQEQVEESYLIRDSNLRMTSKLILNNYNKDLGQASINNT